MRIQPRATRACSSSTTMSKGDTPPYLFVGGEGHGTDRDSHAACGVSRAVPGDAAVAIPFSD